MSQLKDAYDAIIENDTFKAKNIIFADHDLSKASTPFGTLLHVAAGEGNVEIMEILISIGADINAKGGVFKGNALNYAASKGKVEAVSSLLSHGAEMDTDEPERNPLFGAIYVGSCEIARILIAKGIDVTIRYTGESMKDVDALAFAVESGRKEIAMMLSKH